MDGMSLDQLDRFVDGQKKFQAVTSRLNVNLPWSSFATPSGLYKQLAEGTKHEWFTLFYMIEEESPTENKPTLRIYKERFERVKSS
jgi:hypothetical protein